MDFDSLIEKGFRMGDDQKKALKRLGLYTLSDLVYHFPTHYGDVTEVKMISELVAGDDATLYGRIQKLKIGKTFRGKVARSTAVLNDESGSISITWFNQPYIAKMIHENALVKVSGKISKHKDSVTLNNPQIEAISSVPIGVGESLFSDSVDGGTLYPVYPASKGITSNWIMHAIQKILRSDEFKEILDPIPTEILEKYNLPKLHTAMIWVHAPKNKRDAESARKRFAFEEIFAIQIRNQQTRRQTEQVKTFEIKTSRNALQEFTKTFPFTLTDSQKSAIDVITEDFKKGYPMSRLLEGDVGSGKTAVAATTSYVVISNQPDQKSSFGHLQVAYMVPTEILAKQHFENFIQYFKGQNISVALLTGSGCYKFPSKVNPAGYTKISKTQVTKWIANGEIPIVIGTHSLIYKSVQFKNLAYVIIDEQHRFGTAQRQKLARKDGLQPHLLSMTATPIPRTLALTIYGDLDLTLVDQMPLGRKPIITELVTVDKREPTYEKIKLELNAGRQVYVICPRIDEPDPDKEQSLNVKSVREEAKRLKRDIFRDWNIDILHSKMKPTEKDAVMKRFEEHKIDILVATSVVEVGVNVPNATVIIIEGAERFGLSQLHQLRGRVIRSNHQAYCYVFSDTKTQKTVDRLRALKTAKSGFELAEYDLQFRGAGDLYGKKQWGVTDLGMEAIKNIKMVEAARTEAKHLVESDHTLSDHPLLAQKIEHYKELHAE